MDLLYRSKCVDILFDRKRNLLVQKWKGRQSDLDLIYGTKNQKGLTNNLNEIATTQLYTCPKDDLEHELQIMLFQFFPCQLPKA